MTNLQFFQREATSCPDLCVILESRASNNGSKSSSHWSWGHLQRPFGASLAAALLTSRLIKPCFDIVLPLLVEVVIMYHVVVFGCHGGKAVGLHL